MNTYQIVFNCYTCKNPTCGGNPLEEDALLLTTQNQAAARQLFNETKCCKHMKINRIERWHNYGVMQLL